MGELDELALQVGEVRALVDHQPLHLEELGGVRGVGGLVTEAPAGQEGPDRRALGVHHPDLPRRRVRPEEPALDVDVQRVPQVAGRVVGRDVEHLEVGDVGLDLGALVGHEAELPEDRADPADRLDDRMERAARDLPGGRGHVDGLLRQPGRQRGAARARAGLGEGGLDAPPGPR